MKKLTTAFAVAAFAVCALGATRPEVMSALERMSLYLHPDNLDEAESPPSPLEVKARYSLSDGELLQAILDLSAKYGASETNDDHRLSRETAVVWIGNFGGTNNLVYLGTIMTNASDYAQQSAVGAGIVILRHSPRLIPYARDIVTNGCLYSVGLRRWVQSQLLGMCEEGKSDNYINDPAQHARIAAFFLELADLRVYEDDYLFVDRCAYTLNPTYRHSQRRRDNLAAARPSGLTGLPAGIYDARQRDAVQNE